MGALVPPPGTMASKQRQCASAGEIKRYDDRPVGEHCWGRGSFLPHLKSSAKQPPSSLVHKAIHAIVFKIHTEKQTIKHLNQLLKPKKYLYMSPNPFD